ncbi:peptide synthetase [Brevibacterium sp. 50QC2O2]|uniref:peptide synthetase n=1 Tax=Brevibacterium sp. 50QC2O2 TaxID=2968459 RepID=UPI00211D1445|nr:peptide synthetase [Brevibacterium sp. 50QC2O2]MCQ9387469.1 peptide synthetase [Brevibacterium sp. 50QC2O2]
MRLSNITWLRLPFGRVFGYDVSVSEPGEELPVSFDQARHVGEGDRPGSWMALSFTLPAPCDRAALAAAWLEVIARHGTLRSVFTPGPDGPELHRVQVGPGGWAEHPVGPGQAVNEALGRVFDDYCRPYSRPSHRLCVVETATAPTVVIAADHAHVDMWSMLVIVRDLLTALSATEAARGFGEPGDAARPRGALPEEFAAHTRALAQRRPAPAGVRRRWAQILHAGGDAMPTFPLPLGAAQPGPERVEVRDVLDREQAAALSERARAEGVSTLALVIAAMAQVTRELADRPLRAVFPVHSRYEERWHDSVGWFITNSVIEVPGTDPLSAAAALKEAIGLGSHPLAEVLAPFGGMPRTPEMFAISWLDLRRLPVRIDSVGLDAQYVSARVSTDGVMLWFIVDDQGLHLRCRYPDTLRARHHVGTWLDRVVEELRTLSARPASA